MTPLQTHSSLSAAPLLPLPWLYAFAGLGVILLTLALVSRAPGTFWRLLALVFAFAMLANPIMEHALLQPVRDIAILAIDDSASQQLTGRPQQVEKLLPALRARLGKAADLDIREIHVPGRDSTALAGALAEAMAEIPPERRAGAILVTDGQVHDLADHLKTLQGAGPVHALLTGSPAEQDRRIELIEVPHYGIVGKTVKARLRVRDAPQDNGLVTQITIRALNGDDQIIEVKTGQTVTIDLPVDHAGGNIFTIAVPPLPNDLSLANNRAVIRVHGVREKLRVLLVSGEPHPVERTWRNLLRADTAVDLVHFTILRPPHKQDATPTNEVSLIAFPVEELFQNKLKSFDLIIFDRFRKQGMLPMQYYDNIARYVEEGGAFLDASGSSYVTSRSLYQTPLARILPSSPRVLFRLERYTPALTKRGKEHPITRKLPAPEKWGPWYHHTETRLRRGQVLMEGLNAMPLLIIDRVGKGRVAQLHSDSMWLWAHGHQGGGPSAELLRNLAHWLMKEPELEEDQLQLDVTPAGEAYQLRITRPTPDPAIDSVTLTAPDGNQQELALKLNGESASVTLTVTQIGAYTVTHGGKDQMIVVGDPNAPERQDLLATPAILAPLLQTGGGGAYWLADYPEGVAIRRTGQNARQSGEGWLGLRRNDQSIATGMRAAELLPAWAWAILIAAAIMLGWRREGK